MKIMHSKWFDACMQIFAFDQIENHNPNPDHDAFCRHVGTLFIQLSAMATLVLRVDHYSPIQIEALRQAQQESLGKPSGIKAGPGAQRSSVVGIEPRQSVFEARQSSAPARMTTQEGPTHKAPATTFASSKPSSSPNCGTRMDRENRRPVGLGMRKKSMKLLMSGRKHSVDGSMGTVDKPLLSDEEITFLKGFPCPVRAMVQRICRTVTTRQMAGGVIAPSPLVSRIFQELSNGMLGYENCTKIKEVPVPFAYVQYNALLLLTFAIITPVAVAGFTRNVVLSVFISILIVGSFGAMWLVTNELEDPFGSDDNDLPLVRYHDVFAQSINEMCKRAWLPRDQWTVANGNWSDPRLGLALNESMHAARLSMAAAPVGPNRTASQQVLAHSRRRSQEVADLESSMVRGVRDSVVRTSVAFTHNPLRRTSSAPCRASESSGAAATPHEAAATVLQSHLRGRVARRETTRCRTSSREARESARQRPNAKPSPKASPKSASPMTPKREAPVLDRKSRLAHNDD